MKRTLYIGFTLFCLALVPTSYAQTNLGCDSLNLDSIYLNPNNSQEILIQVNNRNTVENFPSPTFVLLDNVGDTIAKETVTHQQIIGKQLHSLSIKKQPTLPLTVDIDFYINNYSTYTCRKTQSIKDTVSFSCDSINIDTLFYDSQKDELTMVLDNFNKPSAAFVNYPSFYLLSDPGDTLAISDVWLFALGYGYNQLVFKANGSITLPISGYIDFYSGFGNRLVCRFPIYLNAQGVLSEKEQPFVDVSWYPNPAKQGFTIKTEQKVNYCISNSRGQSILKGETNQRTNWIACDQLPRGLYFIHFWDENGAQKTEKILLN